LRHIVELGIEFDNLEDALVPIEVVATSLTDGTERWIGRGPAVEAVLASAAIPAIFPPIVIDGDLLVDGGVMNNVPISRAIAAGATRIYVLLCGPLGFHPPVPKRPIEAVLTSFYAAIHARFTRDLASLPAGVEVVVFSGGADPGGDYRDFSASAELVEQGRAEVSAVLDGRQPPAEEAAAGDDLRPLSDAEPGPAS
jgi:NTE family protein